MDTCAYLVNDHPTYLRMAATSIGGIRKHNADIPISVILLDQGEYDTKSFRDVCEHYNVNIMDRKRMDEDFFLINKALIGEVPGDRILFIDTDTFVLGDVGVLFRDYSGYDVVACENKWVNEGWNQDYLSNGMRPFNSGVMLWNADRLREAALAMPQICVDLRDRKYPLSEYLHAVESECWNREEFAWNVYVADNDLGHQYFDSSHCHNILWEQDIERIRKTIILHTYNANWKRVHDKLSGKTRKRIPSRFIKR